MTPGGIDSASFSGSASRTSASLKSRPSMSRSPRVEMNPGCTKYCAGVADSRVCVSAARTLPELPERESGVCDAHVTAFTPAMPRSSASWRCCSAMISGWESLRSGRTET
jgi:hypothetical protein